MNPFQTADYTPTDAPQWDTFIAGCPMATFLHSRRFLSCHGERFRDRSLLLWKNTNLCGVLPAAESDGAVVSHPGATFGGIVHNGALGGENMQYALAAVATHYRQAGFNYLLYKATPACYRRRPCDDDIYALHHAGAKLTVCNLSSVVDLQARGPVSARRRRGIKKAGGLKIFCGTKYAPAIWTLLKENLSRRHGALPTHTLDDILQLSELFPDNIKFYSGRSCEKTVCAVVLFISASVWHAQYIAADDAGRKICALDFLFEHLIASAAAADMRYFSFGTSNEPEKKSGELNAGLCRFKHEFGGGGGANLAFMLAL